MAKRSGPAGRRMRTVLLSALAALLAIPVIFLASGAVGAAIPRNAGWQEPVEGVTIMVETNGVHTALVMPILTEVKDWRADFPTSDIADPAQPYSHVAVSWGERQVFLETPTWADLSAGTILRILFHGGQGMLHVAHYAYPAPDATIRPLRITTEQYRRLVKRIEAVVPSAPRRVHQGYYNYDVFYETTGRYSFANTCNQWTSDTLAAAGIRTGRWTPFAGGVMQWVPNLNE